MATLTQSQNNNLIHKALQANGIFSGISGLMTLLGATMLVQFFGAGTALFFIVLGAGLIFHAVTLYMNTRTQNVNRYFAWYAIAGDIAWVLATALILLTNAFDLSSGGKWLLLIIGDIVLIFAIVQFIGLRRMK